MTVFLTSSPCVYQAPRAIINPENCFLVNLFSFLPENPRCLFVASAPDDPDFTDRVAEEMATAFRLAGLDFSQVETLDRRSQDDAAELISDSDFIVLCGGHGVIKHNSLHNLLSEIEGKVWEVCVPEEEITALQEKFSVTSITKSESEPGKVILRVISDTAPHPSAKTLSPVLEDYYLMLFGDNILTSDQT